MARNMQPIAKRCKALGISPAVMGYKNKETNRNPKGQMRRKKSEYALQLNEKQKVKFIYGMLEKQFYSYYEKATKMQGKAGENLLVLCERRLDNVVFRLGFAATRRQARQLVPSYMVKPGEVISVCENSRSSSIFTELTGEKAPVVLLPKWLEKTDDAFTGKVIAMPSRDDIDYPVEEHLIVELYSK